MFILSVIGLATLVRGRELGTLVVSLSSREVTFRSSSVNIALTICINLQHTIINCIHVSNNLNGVKPQSHALTQP